MAAVRQELHAAREKQRQGDETFRRFSDSGMMGIAEFHLSGQFVFANEALLDMIGYPAEEMTAGRVWWEQLTPPEWERRQALAMEELNENGSCAPYEREYLRQDGTRFWHAPPSGARPIRVLIVEDNRDAAMMLKDLLEMNGHEVETALTGPEAVRAAHDHHPDVVLCDIGLPGMDGYEVAAALRSAPGGAPQRLVAVTGYGEDADRRRTREAGFQYHLVKPVDPTELREVLLSLADSMAG